jgi:hypothetical protein
MFNCAYCRAVLVLEPRPPAKPEDADLPEAERLKLLWKQTDADHSRGTTGFSHMVKDGLHDAAHVTEALGLWNELRAELRRQPTRDVADRFFVFTKVVADQLSTLGEQERQRAVLETATELLPDASDRQVMYARLARKATNAGELESARGWLDRCDARSVVIEADSEYRLSEARLALAERDYRRVFAQLGLNDGAVPIHSRGRMLAAVFRAHAYESLGDLDSAVSELRIQAERSASRLRVIAESFCPKSLEKVR